MPAPTEQDNWIAEFVTYMVINAEPPRGNKFARTLANLEWRNRGTLTGTQAAERCLKQLSVGVGKPASGKAR